MTRVCSGCGLMSCEGECYLDEREPDSLCEGGCGFSLPGGGMCLICKRVAELDAKRAAEVNEKLAPNKRAA